MLQHVTAEPRVCVARWNKGKLTVWDSLQYTFATQASLAYIFKIPMSKVRVICDFMGGGFGDKGYTERYQRAWHRSSRMKTGHPVRIEFGREENFLAATHRYPMVCYLKYGAKKDGTLTAIQAKVIADIGAYCHMGNFFGANVFGIMETMKGVYRCPNLKAEGYNAYTNKPEGGFMRCVGHPQGQVAQEIHMDIMAEKLGLDPVAFRLKNHARLEDGDQDKKLPFSSNGMEECIRKGAEAFGWAQKWQKPGTSPGPVKKGFGMAIHSCRHGAMTLPCTGDGENQLRRDGQRVSPGPADIGGSQKSTMAMIAAEELGIPLDAVSVTAADTEVTLDTGSSGGSKQTIGTGTRGQIGGRRCQEGNFFEIAATELKTAKESLEIRDGKIYPQGSDKGISMTDVLKKAPVTITGRGTATLAQGSCYVLLCRPFCRGGSGYPDREGPGASS